MKALPIREFERKQKSIPPLSQSRHGDVACESLYVCKHVQGTRLGESEPAARGPTKSWRRFWPFVTAPRLLSCTIIEAVLMVC
jgi:hypothetical protein